MNLRFTPRAVRDITEIASYIHDRDPRAAIRVRQSILDAIQTLIMFPGAGRPQALENVRKLITRRYRYLVYYRLDSVAGEIVVLTIQHPAREREAADR